MRRVATRNVVEIDGYFAFAAISFIPLITHQPLVKPPAMALIVQTQSKKSTVHHKNRLKFIIENDEKRKEEERERGRVTMHSHKNILQFDASHPIVSLN